jgi:hypothetical protein
VARCTQYAAYLDRVEKAPERAGDVRAIEQRRMQRRVGHVRPEETYRAPTPTALPAVDKYIAGTAGALSPGAQQAAS